MSKRHFDPARTEWVVREGPVKCIRLRDVLMGAATFVVETSAGLFIHGDCTIGDPRGCGTFDAKTLSWLARARGAYLHKRFLSERWSAAEFVSGIRAILADEDVEDLGYDLEELREIVRLGAGCWQEAGEAGAFEAWSDAKGEGEDFPGHALDPKSCELLDEVAACVAELFARGDSAAAEVGGPGSPPSDLIGAAEAELEVACV